MVDPVAKPVDEGATGVDAVVSAAMTILLESGPDAVHLARIASRVGLALEQLETTYAHSGEVLHSLWESELRLEFREIVAQASDLMSGRLDSIRSGEPEPPQRRAAVHLLVVAHRFDELREVVPFDVQRILYEYESPTATTVERSVFRALIGWLIGAALEPGQQYGDSVRILEHIGWRRNCWAEVEAEAEVERTPALSLSFDEAGDMSRDILGACTRIVAQGGIGRATLLRIARMAGYPLEVLDGMYGHPDHLIAEYIRSVFGLLFSHSRFLQYLDSSAHATMRLEVWLEPDLRIRRSALLESVLASNFSPFLKSAFLKAAEDALADMRLSDLAASELDLEVDGLRFIASRQIALGLAVLDEVEIDRGDRDWSAFLKVFLSRPA